ncbi:FliH/SctL family protein [Massilia sp. TSP1-1-2]|uniref:FliH/SctL family protein n=1 Tax=Massilia sp. TSP1-1-2 TaxID=2804649 RepID=UPI003CF34B8D
MDPIIRHAPLSPFARRIGRACAPAAASSDTASGAAVAPVAAAVAAAPMPRTGTPGVYLASSVAAVAQPAATSHDYDTQLARAAAEHTIALQQRDKQIAALRQASDKAALALAAVQAEAERRGYAAGAGMGEQAGRAEYAAQVERCRGLASQIEEARSAAIARAELAMVDIAFAAVCRIIGEQGVARATIAAAVSAAIAANRSRDQLTVRLHPDDAALLNEGALPGEGLRYAPDPLVSLGGCIVESAGGTLDARFETQLALLAAALKAARALRASSKDAA